MNIKKKKPQLSLKEIVQEEKKNQKFSVDEYAPALTHIYTYMETQRKGKLDIHPILNQKLFNQCQRQERTPQSVKWMKKTKLSPK